MLRGACLLFAITCVSALSAAEVSPTELAQQILRETQTTGGFIVHLPCGNGELTAALKASDGFQVHGLDPSAEQIAKTRKSLLAQGVYGDVAVEQLRNKALPYIEGMVNLVVAENPDLVSPAEIMRVLRPLGVAYVKQGDKWEKTVKPWPKEIDDWTHYFHDASGNAVAHDQVVDQPERLQWVGSPRWSRHHDRMASMSALVSSKGRLFYIMDEGSRVSIQLPSKWKLIARDGFNGTILWKQDIPNWHDQMWPLKSGPTQLTRRLVSDEERIFITLGIKAPVSCLEAATGKLQRVYEGSEGAEEIVHEGGTLFVLVNKQKGELDDFAPLLNSGDQGRVGKEFGWNEEPRELHCFDATSGSRLWKLTHKIVPLTLVADDKHVVFHDGERLVCLDRKTGEQIWATAPAARRRFVQFNFGPRVVLYKDVVLHAGGEGKMTSYDSTTGKELWTSEHAASGYQSPQDLLVSNGLVWVAPTTSGNLSGIFKGRDPRTGEVKVEFPPDVETYWFHHRCYIAKATDRFLIPSRTGIEVVDFNQKKWDINHWVRGGCLYGIMPCNGLIYAPPHNCACFPEAKLYGFNALAGASDVYAVPDKISEEGRLEKGPAYAAKIEAAAVTSADWPTYRHDSARSGSTKSPLPEKLSSAWETKLTGRLSSPIVVGEKLFIAQIDQHTLHALHTSDGSIAWSYITGGRIDSPPTWAKGKLYFGSADGWVYCLRASDGELVWRYRAAFEDRRLMAFEQLESVWPVPGTVLVEKDVAHFAVGRSSFLDAGIRMLRMDAITGEKLTETVMDDIDPDSGDDLQTRTKTLQGPVGLTDIMTSDGEFVYMKSQKFDKDGKRLEIGPVSGDAAVQGSAQGGEDRHLFAPMGFLDDTWFHRSYWVYGKNFAGGHNGYHQAGKYTPSGRILVFNEDEVFGYAREPQYYRWTTPLEHQLFAAGRNSYGLLGDLKGPAGGGKKNRAQPAEGVQVSVENSPSLDPTGKPIVVEAWIKPAAPSGVILSHGGPANGYALVLNNRRPAMVVRSTTEVAQVEAKEQLGKGWQHVVGVLQADKTLKIFVNGTLSASGKAPALVAEMPKQILEIGSDSNGSVGDYPANYNYVGGIDEVRVFHRELTAEEIEVAATDPEKSRALNKEAVFACTFDAGNVKDESGNKNDGLLGDVPTDAGKVGTALLFPKPAAGKKPAGAGAPAGQLAFQHRWSKFVPVFARAMVLADKTLVILGPPDFVDEEKSLTELAAKNVAFQAELKKQDDSLNGKLGGLLWMVSTEDGSRASEIETNFLPVFDGLISAQGKLFVATTDGRVVCLK